jgi:predicted ATPase/DNA-binding CsgD family transcriptional regulator
MVVTTLKNGKRMVNALLNENLSDREQEILNLLAQGTADKEIAAKLYLSLNTVKWHNRQIYAKLGVSSRTQAVAQAKKLDLLGAGKSPQKPAFQILNNLPAPVSSFVGREKEIEEVKTLLQSHRLVTLTGPGGVGKTRLALEVARSLMHEDRFPDGIFFAELAGVSDPARIGEAILDTLGLRMEVGQDDQEGLRLFLKDKILLLLLDNFEHLLEGSPLVNKLLAAVPDLSVLATSREAIHLSGEQCFGVPPLDVHPSQDLFIQRAREVNTAFDPGKEDLPLIDQICTHLDNLPLAIELAAARMKMFSIQGLNSRLEDRFHLLTRAPRDAPERHRTLEAAIEWSYDLLKKQEQIIFRRLAVFQGSRTIDAVQNVCCFDLDLDALDGLESLLSKSLIKTEEGLDGETRFYLLENLHDFAWDRLIESEEQEEINRKHAEYFAQLLNSDEKSRGYQKGGIHWFQMVEADFENIRKAHHWTFDHGEHTLMLDLNASLSSFWGNMSRHLEGREWIEDCLKIVDDAPLDLQAKIYRAAAAISLIFYQYDRSRFFYESALERFEKLGDKHKVGKCHNEFANLLVRSGNFDEGLILKHYQAAVDICSEVGDLSTLANAWTVLGIYYDLCGKAERAYQVRRKALALAEEAGDEIQIWFGLYFLGLSELMMDNPKVSKELFLDLLNRERTHLKFRANIEGTIEILAGPEFALGKSHRAAILLSVGNALRKKKGGIFVSDFHKQRIQDILELVQNELNPVFFDQAWERGQQMSFEEAITFALEEVGP